MTKVLIVEDQRTAREIMQATIEKSSAYQLEGVLADAGNAHILCMSGRVDLVLMDVYTLDGENGIEAAKRIKKDFPHIKIIIVTSMPEESFIRKAREAGCEGFWYKDICEEDLISVMDRIMAGDYVYPDETPAVKIGLAKSSEFTEREMDVLLELINGHSQKETAEQLGVAYDTVRTHIKSILSKTGYDSPNRLIAEVSQKCLIIPGFFAEWTNKKTR